MAVDAAFISRLRRMVAEPTTTTYSDSILSEILLRYICPDVDGNDPDEDDWTESYDMNAAAAEVWVEKAADLADGFDFSGDGSSFQRSQAYENAMKQARYYQSRRRPDTIRMDIAPKPLADMYDVD